MLELARSLGFTAREDLQGGEAEIRLVLGGSAPDRISSPGRESRNASTPA
jgi:hypothetical protein